MLKEWGRNKKIPVQFRDHLKIMLCQSFVIYETYMTILDCLIGSGSVAIKQVLEPCGNALAAKTDGFSTQFASL